MSDVIAVFFVVLILSFFFPSPGLWLVLTSCDCELQNVDVLNPFFLRDLDETSWKSLSGVRANKCILQLVPDLEVNVDIFS